MLNFKDYQERAYTAINEHDSAKDELCNWLVGLSEEVGELMNLMKHTMWGGEDINLEETAKELGDILWYTSAVASTLGLNLEAVADLNISKLEHRFGNKTEFSAERSQDRHKLEQKFSETYKYKQIIAALQQTPKLTIKKEK